MCLFACDFVIYLSFKIINTNKEICEAKIESNQINDRNTILNDGKKMLVYLLSGINKSIFVITSLKIVCVFSEVFNKSLILCKEKPSFVFIIMIFYLNNLSMCDYAEDFLS